MHCERNIDKSKLISNVKSKNTKKLSVIEYQWFYTFATYFASRNFWAGHPNIYICNLNLAYPKTWR